METIMVYSKPNCMACKMTYRALDQANLDYQVIDITENENAFIYVTQDLGYQQAPIVVVDDQDHWAGFRPDQISRLAAVQG